MDTKFAFRGALSILAPNGFGGLGGLSKVTHRIHGITICGYALQVTATILDHTAAAEGKAGGPICRCTVETRAAGTCDGTYIRYMLDTSTRAGASLAAIQITALGANCTGIGGPCIDINQQHSGTTRW